MAFWLTQLFRSLLGVGRSEGAPPYIWSRRGITRAARTSFDGRGHFGVDWNVYKIEELPGSAKKVYAYLSRVADAEGYTSPFLRTIALRTGLSKSTVGKALKELEDAGLVEIQQRYSRRGGSSNLYQLRKLADVYHQVDAQSSVQGRGTNLNRFV